jgi:hypothetical protein
MCSVLFGVELNVIKPQIFANRQVQNKEKATSVCTVPHQVAQWGQGKRIGFGKEVMNLQIV